MAYQIGQKTNIRNIKDTYADLLALFDESDAIEIDLDAATECDLSLIQLIESARNHAAAAGKDIALLNPANDATVSVLGRAGFLDGFSAEDAKFWLHKEMI
jgi:hypothetical protein